MKVKELALLAILAIPFSLIAQSASDQLEIASRSATTGAGYPEFTVNPPATSSQVVVYASSYGLSTTASGGANYTALANAIAACKQYSQSKLVVNPGTYLLCNYQEEKNHLDFSGMANFVFEGNGAVFLCQGYGHFIYASGASQVQLQDFTIGWNWTNETLQSLAQIVAVPSGSNYMDLQYIFETGANTPNHEPLPSAGATVHEIVEVANTGGVNTNYTFVNNGMGVYGAQQLLTNETSLPYANSNIVRFYAAGGNSWFQNHGAVVGKYCCVRHYEYEYHGVEVESSSDVTISNVTVYSTLGMGFMGLYDTRLQVLNSRLTRPPAGQLASQYAFSSAADGFNMSYTKGGLKLENSEIGYAGDDAINIHNGQAVGVSVSGSSMTLGTTDKSQNSWDENWVNNEIVDLRNSDFSPTGWIGTVSGSPSFSGGECTFDFTTSDGTPPSGSSIIAFDDSNTSGNYIIRGNWIHHNKVRGTIVHCPNGTIENNTYASNYDNGLFIACIARTFYEGSYPTNIIVRGNVWNGNDIQHNNFPWMPDNVCIGGVPYSGGLSTYPICRDILFVNNVIENCPYGALSVASATNVVIDNNVFENPNQFNMSDIMGSIEFTNCDGIVFSNNSLVFTPGDSSYKNNIYVSPTCQYNMYIGPSTPLTLPANWTNQDIGNVTLGGNSVYAAGVFTVDGSGPDIWGTEDSFQYLYQAIGSNSQIIAQVLNMQNTDPWAKAGLMLRNDVTPDAQNVGIFVTPGNGVTMQTRTIAGGSSLTTNTIAGLTTPIFLSLSVSGPVVYGYESPDGTNWTLVGTVTNVISSNSYVGLAVTSKSILERNFATFDNVNIAGTVPGGLAANAGNGQATLTWNAAADATNYVVSYGTNSGGPYPMSLTTANTSATVTNLVNGITYYFVVAANGADGLSENCPEVSATPRAPALNPADYRYSMRITLGGYNRATALTNFPLLVNLSTNLAGFSYSQFASRSGYDLNFTDGGDQTVLNYEIDQWNTNGVSPVWVNVPLIASSATSIIAYWGKFSQSNELATCTNGSVWSNYAAVFHLKESGWPYADSTTMHPATSGIPPVLTGAGMIGSAETFDGTSQYIVPSGTIDLGNGFSLSAWVKLNLACTNMQPIFDSANGTWNGNGVFLYINTWNTANGSVNLETGDGSTGTTATTAAGAVGFGAWHYVCASVNRSAGTATLYVDGANATTAGSAATDFATNFLIDIGRLTNGNNYIDGTLDEVRIDTAPRPADWVWATWMNVVSNSTLAGYSAVTNTPLQSPPLTVSLSSSGLMLNWADQGAGFVVYSTTSLTPPVQWTPVTNYTTLGSGQLQIPSPTNGSVFYRLQAP